MLGFSCIEIAAGEDESAEEGGNGSGVGDGLEANQLSVFIAPFSDWL